MFRVTWLLLLLVTALTLQAQQSSAVIDSQKARLERAPTDKERIAILSELSRTLMSVDRAQADEYARKMMEVAELSRDRKLMIKALMANGERYSYMSGMKEFANKALAYYNEALELARQNKLDEETAGAYLALSALARRAPDADKALNYCNQANSYISTLNNDSLRLLGHVEYGSVYTLRREKLLALRNYLAAQRLAEDMKSERMRRYCFSHLSSFYASIEDYDRAIDYAVRALDLGKKLGEQKYLYGRPNELTGIGQLYSYKKNYDMATFYYEKAIALADSLKFQPLKMSAYVALLNNYLYAGKPQEALAYFNQSSDLKAYLTRFGMAPVLDQAYGYIYADLRQFDSAFYYYAKAAPLFERSLNHTSRFSYYSQMGRLNKLAGRYPAAIAYYNRARMLADTIGDPEYARTVVLELDTLYRNTGDYRQSLEMTALAYQYKDSLDKLGKEKDLMQIEAADEQQRQERLALLQAEEKRKRHSIQYVGITIAIAASFIALVMLGLFRVSRTTIRLVGFFSFLMFFEFLFLLFKKNISTITEGEPWKDLLFMIALAAVLLPLHHWLEEKVIHYLTSRQLLQKRPQFKGWRGVFGKKKEENMYG